MKKKQTVLWTATMVATLTLFACVTINIYFPAEQVESAAEDIVNDIRGIMPPQNDGKSGSHQQIFQKIRFAFSPTAAWAADETTVSNPTIRSLKEKMKTRFQALAPFYQKGALNEGSNGYLSIRDTGGLSLTEKRDIKGLVDAENSDRTILYAEVAKALKIDAGQIGKIAEIFANEWKKPVR
ncbi:MAG: DUF1318 domain-containing protein [Desulfatirhabdiaceae bacterium]